MGGITEMFTGSGEEQVTKQDTLTPGQGGLLEKLTGLLSGQIGQGVDPYGGQMTAGASPIQQQMFGGMENLMGGGVLEQILGKFDPTLATGAWEKGVKDPMMEMFTSEILPKILEPFAGSGSMKSGAAGRAAGKAGGTFATQLMSDLSNKLFQGEQAQLGRQAALPGMAMQAGQTQRGVEQDILGEGLQKWQMSQGYNNPWLQQLQTALGTQAGGTTQQQGTASGSPLEMLRIIGK